MKTKQLTIIASLAIGVFACGGNQNSENTTEAVEVVETSNEAVDYKVDPASSTVAWKGGTSGAMVYSHNGVIDIQEGSLTVQGEKVVGGSVVIDMTTIQPLDSASYNEENPASKLVGHLSTGDFFLVEEYPTAKFVIKSMEGNTITGDLTIRDKTNVETVTGVVVESTESGVKASGKLVFDRQKYDVKWEHFMKDVILADDIELNIELSATKNDELTASK